MMRLHLIETAEDIIRNGGKGSDSQMIAVGPSSTPIKASPSAAENAGGKSIHPASLPPPPKVPASQGRDNGIIAASPGTTRQLTGAAVAAGQMLSGKYVLICKIQGSCYS